MERYLNDQLAEKYPSLFRDKDLTASKSLIRYGCECEAGWYDIIDDTCSKLMELNGSKRIAFSQIKEKFGGLRIYIRVENIEDKLHKAKNPFTIFGINIVRLILGKYLAKKKEEIFESARPILHEAESLSYKTCEICSHVGEKSHSNYWVKTVCQKCIDKYETNTYEKN